MTPVPAPVTLACLAPGRFVAAVTVMAHSAASAAAHSYSAAPRSGDDRSESRDAGLVTGGRIDGDRTRPPRYYSMTDRAAGSWPRSGRCGLAFIAAVDSVLSGCGDPGIARRLGLMAREEP
jgi:hypothetical protein